MKKYNNLLALTFLCGALAVVFGAFGAHWLTEYLAPKQLGSFKTGVLYHFVHVLAAVSVLILSENGSKKRLVFSSILFLTGILLFSGSLYLLATLDLIGISNYKLLGPLTPIGGLFFIAAWLNTAVYYYQQEN